MDIEFCAWMRLLHHGWLCRLAVAPRSTLEQNDRQRVRGSTSRAMALDGKVDTSSRGSVEHGNRQQLAVRAESLPTTSAHRHMWFELHLQENMRARLTNTESTDLVLDFAERYGMGGGGALELSRLHSRTRLKCLIEHSSCHATMDAACRGS